MCATAWLDWLSSLPADDRDAAVETRLGIRLPPPDADQPPADELIGYHASSVASIARAIIEVPLAKDDVVIDLGCGLGKVVMLVHLLTGARVCGIELQPALVAEARAAAARHAVDVTFVEGDARVVDLDEGTVFFLYAPFTGSAMATVLERLRRIAERRPIVVVTNGIDLQVPWLVARSIDSFWIVVYHSAIAGVSARGAVTSIVPREARPAIIDLAKG